MNTIDYNHLSNILNDDGYMLPLSMSRKDNPDFFEPFVSSSAWEPPVDIFENSRQFVIELETPGIELSSIEVIVGDTIVFLKAKKSQHDDTIPNPRSNNDFSRSIALPVEVLKDQVKTHYENDLLTLHIPKKAATSLRPIAIDIIQ